MVLIEEKTTYLQKFEFGNDFSLLKEFLKENKIESRNEHSSLVHNLLFSISSNDISSVSEIIKEYSAKTPTSDSQYIYKDLLIFLFVCVTKKFNLEQNWLLNFLVKRKSESEEKNGITKTFQNLITDNLTSNDSYFEIVIVYKNILDIAEKDVNILNETYKKLTNKDFPFYESDFLNLISLRAIDLIVLSKSLDDYEELSTLRDFSEKFNSRITMLSMTLSWTVVLSFLSVTIYFAYKLFFGSEEEQQFLGKMTTIIGIIGLSLTGFGRKNVEEFIKNRIERLFGRKSAKS